jgi:hypothetical protein
MSTLRRGVPQDAIDGESLRIRWQVSSAGQCHTVPSYIDQVKRRSQWNNRSRLVKSMQWRQRLAQ